jgi:ribosomal protein L34E
MRKAIVIDAQGTPRCPHCGANLTGQKAKYLRRTYWTFRRLTRCYCGKWLKPA